MHTREMLKILRIINAERCSSVGMSKASREFSAALREELNVEVSAEQIVAAGSLAKLADLVEVRLAREPNGKSLVDIYAELEHLISEELAHEINYHWYAKWQGDLLDKTDSLEDVEIVIRMEETFGFSISDSDVEQMYTVGQTVRYLWQRISDQSFTLREPPDDVCVSAFTFYELRRLLMTRGHVPRAAVGLDTRLKDLLPTWSSQFWKEAASVFAADLPYGSLLSRILGFERRTAVRELVDLLRPR